MNISEMNHAIYDFCEGRTSCKGCPLEQFEDDVECHGYIDKEIIIRNYNTLFGDNDAEVSEFEVSDNDQTIKADAGKARLTLVPQQVLWDIAEVRAYGLKKYGSAENWKKVEIERYRDASFRHFLKYLSDPKSVDDESGINHLKHLACNIAFLCELEKDGQNEM